MSFLARYDGNARLLAFIFYTFEFSYIALDSIYLGNPLTQT